MRLLGQGLLAASRPGPGWGAGAGGVVNSVREPRQGRSRGAAGVDGEGVLGAIVGSQENGGGGSSCRLPESG